MPCRRLAAGPRPGTWIIPCRRVAAAPRPYSAETAKKTQSTARRYVINEALFPGRESSAHWFMVFDGHGPEGHECAWYFGRVDISS